MGPQFPWAAWAEVQRQKREQEQQTAQNLQGMAGGVGDIIEGIQKKRLMDQLVKAINSQGQPMQDPQLPGTGTTPGMTPPVSGMGAPSPDQSNTIASLMMRLNPQAMVAEYAKRNDPMNLLRMQRLQQLVSGGSGGPGGKPAGYVDEEGNLYTTPQPGTQPVTSQQLPYLAVPKSKKTMLDVLGASGTPRGKFYEARAAQTEISGLNQVERAIDPGLSSRSTPIGAAASSVRRAINGLSLLQQPVVTRTALEATMGDLDSILTQAAATVQGREMLQTPNFLNNLAKYRSFVSSAPDQVKVPSGMVSIYKNILQDLGPIAQKFIQQTVDQRSKFYRQKALQLTTSDQYDQLRQRVMDSYDINKQLGVSSPSNSQRIGRFEVQINP